LTEPYDAYDTFLINSSISKPLPLTKFRERMDMLKEKFDFEVEIREVGSNNQQHIFKYVTLKPKQGLNG
jgi:hypothetical protein